MAIARSSCACARSVRISPSSASGRDRRKLSATIAGWALAESRLPKQAPSVLEALELWHWLVCQLTLRLAAYPALTSQALETRLALHLFRQTGAISMLHPHITDPFGNTHTCFRPCLDLAATAGADINDEMRLQRLCTCVGRHRSTQASGLEGFPLHRVRTMVLNILGSLRSVLPHGGRRVSDQPAWR